jgi:uncharacterized protein YcfJ
LSVKVVFVGTKLEENGRVTLKTLALGAMAMASVALTVAPDTAAARHRHYRHYASNQRHYSRGCHRSSNKTIGTIGGAVGGGLIGNALTHGSVIGTVAGVGGGAWAGHALGKHIC